MRPRCPDCRGPLERRGDLLICADRRSCRATPHPKEALLLCPKCGADAWFIQGTVRGSWVREGRHARKMEGTMRVGCERGHRARVELPDDMAPRMSLKRPKQRGF